MNIIIYIKYYMNKLIIFALIFIAILLYLNTNNNSTKTCKEVWIGGPASHVPKPMARWEYN